MSTKELKLKIKKFWDKYEVKIVLILGFIIIASISFEAGVLKGQNWRQKPLMIEKAVKSEDITQNTANTAILGEKTATINQDAGKNTQNCMFVGSKNSNKYHIPTCTWAKQIKPANIVCFSSAEDAVAKGYQPGCLK
jgi:hypothetical protein